MEHYYNMKYCQQQQHNRNRNRNKNHSLALSVWFSITLLLLLHVNVHVSSFTIPRGDVHVHFTAADMRRIRGIQKRIPIPTRITSQRENILNCLEQRRTSVLNSNVNFNSGRSSSKSALALFATSKEKEKFKSRETDSNSVNSVGVKEIEIESNDTDTDTGDADADRSGTSIDNRGVQDEDSSSSSGGSNFENPSTAELELDYSIGTNSKKKKKKKKAELFPSSSSNSNGEKFKSSPSSSSSSSSWTDWSASSSLGSFLLKRKKIEEEEMQKIKDSDTSSHPTAQVKAKVKVGDKNLDTSLNQNEINELKLDDTNTKEKRKDDDKVQVQKQEEGGIEKGEKKEILDFVNATSSSVQREIDQTIKNIASFTTGKKEKNIYIEEGEKNEDEDILMIGLDEELVREVDESITILSNSRQTLMRDIDILPVEKPQPQSQQQPRPPPPLVDYDESNKEISNSSPLPLSGPDHTTRIERDMRHLAVSIASTVENAQQWKEFCEDGGGLLPLLECIRDGAEEIEEGIGDGDNMNDGAATAIGLIEQKEEAFVAAWSACKTLRDLCTISKPFAAIVTDSILRANTAWSQEVEQSDGTIKLEGGIISNFVTLLRYAQQDDILYNPRSRRGKMRALRNRGVQRMGSRKQKRDARKRCGLYVTQLLLEMSFASDKAVETFRATPGLTETVLACSSYAPAKRLRRRLIRYPIEVIKRYFSSKTNQVMNEESPFLAAASINNGLSGQTQGSANQLLASIGHNVWYPKTPGQKGLRILCLDGGGTRGITAISSMRSIVQAIGGVEVCDAFDMIVGTSTGAIIAFLVGLRRESSSMARKRYDRLIKRIFVKSALSTPMLLFTTATYDETPFNTVVGEILRDNSMLSSRADPRVPLVFAISSKMSSTPTQICLFRNYNYGGGEMRDTFVEDPIEAKKELDLELEDDIFKISGMLSYEEDARIISKKSGGSRHPGSFRVLQRAALRATTAAPTVFKPVLMGGELYCDGGIVASNPAAVAIHEARTIYPSVPIELVVSCGTGAFVEEKSEPRIGWDGIIGQIVNSATDGEQIHHILEDILGGQGGTAKLGRSSVSETKYYRFNPVVGTADTFPIDGTDPIKLEELSQLTTAYMNEPEQAQKLNEIVDILKGRTGWRGRLLSKIGINL